MSRKRDYTFVNKPESTLGKDSLIVAFIGLILMVAAAAVSFLNGGEGGTVAGVIGLGAFLVSVYGFFLGIRGLREKSSLHRMAYIGTILSGLMIIAWIGMILYGEK